VSVSFIPFLSSHLNAFKFTATPAPPHSHDISSPHPPLPTLPFNFLFLLHPA
jgi:hypothetical protein